MPKGKRLDISFYSFGDGWNVDALCSKCGENMSVCTCKKSEGFLAPGEHRLVYKKEKRRGKWITVVGEFHIDKYDAMQLLKRLKSSLGCGGTLKGGRIELQGQKLEEVKEFLKSEGFTR